MKTEEISILLNDLDKAREDIHDFIFNEIVKEVEAPMTEDDNSSEEERDRDEKEVTIDPIAGLD